MTVCLRGKHGAHPQLDTDELEDIQPDIPREHGVMVADNRGGEAMELHDAIKEGLGD